jgi:hypothetical protein
MKSAQGLDKLQINIQALLKCFYAKVICWIKWLQHKPIMIK